MANPTQAQIDKLTTNLSRYDSIINGAYNETVTLDSHTVKSISGYLAELAANTLRGLWATATSYAIKDIVEESGNWYVCLDPHTSGTFSSDLAAGKWALYQINLSGNLNLPGDLDISGGLTVATNTLVVDPANNRVGIGTSSPSEKLHLKGTDVKLQLESDGGNSSYWYQQSLTSYLIADSDWIFYTNGSENMKIDANGKVFMPSLATSGVDNGTLKYNSATGEIWVD